MKHSPLLMAVVWLVLIILLQIPVSMSWGAPSFDCSKASSSVEIVICGDPQLSDYDWQMADLYNKLRNRAINKDQFTAHQRAWVKAREKECGQARDAVRCLKSKYEERISQLQNLQFGDSLLSRDNGNGLAANDFMLGGYVNCTNAGPECVKDREGWGRINFQFDSDKTGWHSIAQMSGPDFVWRSSSNNTVEIIYTGDAVGEHITHKMRGDKEEFTVIGKGVICLDSYCYIHEKLVRK